MPKWITALFIIASFIQNAGAQCSVSRLKSLTNTAVAPGFSELEENYDVRYYFIDLEVNDTSTFIAGNTKVLIHILASTDTLVFELNNSLTVDSVKLSDRKVNSFLQEEMLLKINPETSLLPEEELTVSVYYRGGSGGSGFFSGISNGLDNYYRTRVTYTLSEPFQASYWFPVKQDLTDKADSARIHITVDTSLMAGSNGVLEKVVDIGNGKHRFQWFLSSIVDYYLLSVAVADYTDFSFYSRPEGLEDSILVMNYIYDHPEIMEREKERIEKTDSLLVLFSRLFGIYPFYREKYGHCMAPMGGGMEHQTMTTLQSFNFELVAHELAHQWFGDYVTCSSWQDIWVNEGFASYCEYIALENLVSRSEAERWMEGAQSIALRIDKGSVYISEESADDVSRIFSGSLSYKKGATILHMLRYEIDNDDLFFRIMRTYLDRYKYSVASGKDFAMVVNELTGKDYTYFFDQWYYGKGFPEVKASWKQAGDSLQLRISQDGSDVSNKLFRMHMDIQFLFNDGSDTTYRFYMDEPQEKFVFYCKGTVNSVRLDPESRILMKSFVYENLPSSELMEVGPNPFNGSLYLSFVNYLTEKQIRISDMEGKIVFSRKYNASVRLELNLQFLNPGIYLLIVEDEKLMLTRKIVKV